MLCRSIATSCAFSASRRTPRTTRQPRRDQTVILRRTVEVVVDLEDVAAFAEARLAQALPRRWRHRKTFCVSVRDVGTSP
jgi:hypothetical protein